MSENQATKITLELTVDQARALNEALDVYSRLCLGQLTEVANMVREGAIPQYAGDAPERVLASVDVTEDVESLLNTAKAVLGYPRNVNLGICNPHVSLTGRRAFEVMKVLQRAVAELDEPNPSFRGVHYDGLVLRHTQDPAPVAYATATETAGVREDLISLVGSLPRRPQRQDGTSAQLQDLRAVANKLGMYDASDVLRGLLERSTLRDADAG